MEPKITDTELLRLLENCGAPARGPTWAGSEGKVARKVAHMEPDRAARMLRLMLGAGDERGGGTGG